MKRNIKPMLIEGIVRLGLIKGVATEPIVLALQGGAQLDSFYLFLVFVLVWFLDMIYKIGMLECMPRRKEKLIKSKERTDSRVARKAEKVKALRSRHYPRKKLTR